MENMQKILMCLGTSFVAVLLSACAPNYLGAASEQRYVSSTYGVTATPYAYGNPSPYGYHTPWGLPNAETIGYLYPDQFSPRPGLVCERARHMCYSREGVNYIETEYYLGSRAKWKRDKAFGTTQTYFMMP